MNSPIKKLNLRTKTLLAIVITVFILVLVVIWAFLINSSEITTNFSMMKVGSSPDTLEALTVNVGYWIVKSLKIYVAGGCFSVMPTNFPPYFSDKDWYI